MCCIRWVLWLESAKGYRFTREFPFASVIAPDRPMAREGQEVVPYQWTMALTVLFIAFAEKGCGRLVEAHANRLGVPLFC